MALKNCKYCGHEFIPIRKNNIFCSKECQSKYHYEKRKKQNHTGNLKEVECIACHKIFRQRHAKQKYCCNSCKDDYYKTKKKEQNQKYRGKVKYLKYLKHKKTGNGIEARARRQKETGISDGKLEPFKNCPEQLQKIIRYQQEIGKAYPTDPNEKRVIGKRMKS